MALHDEAVVARLAYMDRHATASRRLVDGELHQIRGQGPAAAVSRHQASGAGGSQLQSHALVVNVWNGSALGTGALHSLVRPRHAARHSPLPGSGARPLGPGSAGSAPCRALSLELLPPTHVPSPGALRAEMPKAWRSADNRGGLAFGSHRKRISEVVEDGRGSIEAHIEEAVERAVERVLKPYLRRICEPEPATYTATQAATVLQVSADTIARMVRRGVLYRVPYVDGKLLIPRLAVDELLARDQKGRHLRSASGS